MSVPVLSEIHARKERPKKLKTSSGYGAAIIYIVFLLFILAVIWAASFTLDEVVRGDGKIIPSTEVKTVQHLEGGIVKEIYVTHGQKVSAGQPLILLDTKRVSATLAESKSELAKITLAISRYEALLQQSPLVMPDGLSTDHQAAHRAAYNAAKQRLEAELSAIDFQKRQSVSELKGVEKSIETTATELRLAQELLNTSRKLKESGAISEFEFKKERREALSVKKELRSLEARKSEIENKIEQKKSDYLQADKKFKSDRWAKLGEFYNQRAAITETLKASDDGMYRATIRAPVDGIIKQIFINTQNSVIQPGAPIAEIVPVNDELLVEVKVSPKDIGFIIEGMKSIIKVSAYDFTIFGGLEGVVKTISPDTIITEDEIYYNVYINVLNSKSRKREFVLKPGMTLSVDILTGEKTVLHYLLKPLLRGLNESLNER